MKRVLRQAFPLPSTISEHYVAITVDAAQLALRLLLGTTAHLISDNGCGSVLEDTYAHGTTTAASTCSASQGPSSIFQENHGAQHPQLWIGAGGLDACAAMPC